MTTLYRVYDDADRLLYVGISDGPFLRLGQHSSSARWVEYATKVTLQRYTDRETARDAELAAIQGEDPVWNLAGRSADRFVQWMAAYPDGNPDEIDVEALCQEAMDKLLRPALLHEGGV